MITCCEIALALCGVILVLFAMVFNYSLKLKDRQIILEKQNQEMKKEIQEVERVNGKEKADIAELQKQVKELEKKSKNHGN
jgi:Tfp pilus assembly protein PilN